MFFNPYSITDKDRATKVLFQNPLRSKYNFSKTPTKDEMDKAVHMSCFAYTSVAEQFLNLSKVEKQEFNLLLESIRYHEDDMVKFIKARAPFLYRLRLKTALDDNFVLGFIARNGADDKLPYLEI